MNFCRMNIWLTLQVPESIGQVLNWTFQLSFKEFEVIFALVGQMFHVKKVGKVFIDQIAIQNILIQFFIV